MTMTYPEALDYIFGFVNYELRVHYQYDSGTFNLQRMTDVLERLGNPHQRYRIVHITGSRGKGSTAAMTERCLREAGYRTGLYTSPHLHTFRERMRVDGGLISQDGLAGLVEHCRPAIEATPGLTTFETITTLAFQYFADQQVDWAVVEVGLGGRLDSTNVVLPEVCAITSISYDHTAILGNTLTMIAREKAGIIKPGVPIVCGPLEDEAMDVVQSVAAERQAPLTRVGHDWAWRAGASDLRGQAFDAWPLATDGRSWNGDGRRALPYWIPLLGKHQLANATVVLAMVEQLRQRGVALPEAAVQRGLANVRWPGRLESLARGENRAPVVVVDGAQNRDSALKLREALQTWFPGRRWVLTFGVSSDHDYVGMWDELFPVSEAVVLTASRHPRAAPADMLAAQARQHNACPERLEVVPSVADALDTAADIARELNGASALVCVAGSLFVVAEAREAWTWRFPDAFPPDDWVHHAEPVTLTVR